VDAETLYRQLGRLIETVPTFPPHPSPLTVEQQQWLARARALIYETNDLTLRTAFIGVIGHIHGPNRINMLPLIMQQLYDALALAEVKAPPSAQGAFIPAKNSFDAFAAINRILQSATSDVLIVDPYLDETILTEFGGSILGSIPLRLLSDRATVKPSLAPAAKAWTAQHGTSRPLAVRYAHPKALHDRLIIIDKTIAHSLTQSFKDFAKRSPAEIVRTDDTAALKISAYEAVWANPALIIA
jgi:hypothetical protein